jgi:hypothetical protein
MVHPLVLFWDLSFLRGLVENMKLTTVFFGAVASLVLLCGCNSHGEPDTIQDEFREFEQRTSNQRSTPEWAPKDAGPGEFEQKNGKQCFTLPQDSLFSVGFYGPKEGEPITYPKDREIGRSFDAVRTGLNDELKQRILKAEALEFLVVGNGRVSEYEWIRELKNLQGLVLYEVEFDSRLDWLTDLKHLRFFRISLNNRPTIETGDFLPYLSKLEALHLYGPEINDAHLPNAGQFPSLWRLHLRDSEITDAGITQIAEAYPNLTDLNLHFCEKLSKVSMPKFAEFRQLKCLYVLGSGLVNDVGNETAAYWELRKLVGPDCHIRTTLERASDD